LEEFYSSPTDKKDKKIGKDGKKKEKKKSEEEHKKLETTNDEDEEDIEDYIKTEEQIWKEQEDMMRQAYEVKKSKHNKIKGNRLYSSTHHLQERRNTNNASTINPLVRLPSHEKREEIVSAVSSSRVSIIQGAAGSGKTTQIPQFLLDNCTDKSQDCLILCCQPRRVAAIGVAERVAYERGEKCGETIGYNVRFDTKLSKQSRVIFLTTGILMNRILDDPTLQGVTHIILDEVHERSLHMDFLLTLARSHIRSNIKIVLMSATLDVELFSNYFKNYNASSTRSTENIPVVSIEGRTFPVQINWMSDIETLLHKVKSKQSARNEPCLHQVQNDYSDDEQNNNEILMTPEVDAKENQIDNSLITHLIEHIVTSWFRNSTKARTSTGPGTKPCILVFLPGAQEIDTCIRTIQENRTLKSKTMCLPLHGQLQASQQKRVFNDYSHQEEVVVIVSTNVAETSLTVPGITDVIDSGHMKETRYNVSTRMQSLTTVWVSHANAIQRAGRAGRVLAGTCWRLYNEDFYSKHLPKQSVCEMKRTPLDDLVLFLALTLGGKKCQLLKSNDLNAYEENKINLEKDKVAKTLLYEDIPLFFRESPEPPSTRSVLTAQKKLIEIGALKVARDHDQIQKSRLFLSPLGYHLANLPMDPHIGKLLIYGGILGCRELVLTVAAALSSRSPFLNLKHIQDTKRKADIEQNRRKLCQKDHYSDHLALCEAFDLWENSDKKQKKLFCQDLHLSTSAMYDIRRLRINFLQNLDEIGMRNHTVLNSKETNNDKGKISFNETVKVQRMYVMAKCALTAGLFPNVVQVQKENVAITGKARRGTVKTKLKSFLVPIQSKAKSNSTNTTTSLNNPAEKETSNIDPLPKVHPSSFNFPNINRMNANDGWLLYHRKMKTSQLYLFDTSLVTSMHLLLFGGCAPPRLGLEKKIKKVTSSSKKGTGSKLENAILLPCDSKNFLEFKSKNEHAIVLVRALRNEIDNLLIEKIRDPLKPLGLLGELVIENIYSLLKHSSYE